MEGMLGSAGLCRWRRSFLGDLERRCADGAQLVLATLVQRATFELVPGQTIAPEPLITLRPKGGIRVVVRRR